MDWVLVMNKCLTSPPVRQAVFVELPFSHLTNGHRVVARVSLDFFCVDDSVRFIDRVSLASSALELSLQHPAFSGAHHG